MYSATGAAESASDTQTANLKGTLGKLKQAASTAVIELGEKFLPVVQTLAEWVLENMPVIQSTIEVVFDYLTTVTNTCVEYITMLKDAASAWVADHQETINTILTAIQNLWQFVQTIFSALMTAAGRPRRLAGRVGGRKPRRHCADRDGGGELDCLFRFRFRLVGHRVLASARTNDHVDCAPLARGR